jgi:hypothetical protein
MYGNGRKLLNGSLTGQNMEPFEIIKYILYSTKKVFAAIISLLIIQKDQVFLFREFSCAHSKQKVLQNKFYASPVIAGTIM